MHGDYIAGAISSCLVGRCCQNKLWQEGNLSNFSVRKVPRWEQHMHWERDMGSPGLFQTLQMVLVLHH